MPDSKKKSYALLGIALLLFSFNSACGKAASAYPFLSWRFIAFYGTGILCLGLYALLWQQVLKRFALSTAYSAKPIALLLSMLWGILLFHEQFKWNMAVGAAIILVGIRIAVTDHGE